jgi:hypothetical protein
MGITDFLLGALCVRCESKRTRCKRNDLPTCAECETTFLQNKAASEEKRGCPLDGIPMEKQIVHKLVIDRCPRCHGVWLDGEELEAIKKASAAEGFGNGMAVGIAIG